MSMYGDYKPGGLSELMRTSSHGAGGRQNCTDARLEALFSPVEKKKTEAKNLKRERTDSADSSIADDTTTVKKVKKQKKRASSKDRTSTTEPDHVKLKQTHPQHAPAVIKNNVDSVSTVKPSWTDTDNTGETVTKNVSSHTNTAEKLACTVFVGNLPKTSTKKSIKSLFQQCGKMDSIRLRSAAPSNLKLPKKAVVIKREFHSERQNINAYVVFKNLSGAKKALALNGKQVDGLHMRVDLADGSQQHDHKKSIFVGNLPFGVHEDAVREHFVTCGPIKNVRLIRDPKTGLGKGFGYVLFEDAASVMLAMKTAGEEFESRKLRIERSTSNVTSNKTIKQKAIGPAQRAVPRLKACSTTDTTDTTRAMKPKVYKDRKEQRQRRKLLKKQRKSTATSMSTRKPSANVLIRNRLAKKIRKKK